MRTLFALPIIALATACASTNVDTAPVIADAPPVQTQVEPRPFDLAMDTVDRLLAAGNEQAAILRLEQLIGMQDATDEERADALLRMAELKMGEGQQLRGAVSSLNEFLEVYPNHARANEATVLRDLAKAEADDLTEQIFMGGLSPMQRFEAFFRLGDHQSASDLMLANALNPDNAYLLDMYQIGYLCEASELTGPAFNVTEPDGTEQNVRFCDFGK